MGMAMGREVGAGGDCLPPPWPQSPSSSGAGAMPHCLGEGCDVAAVTGPYAPATKDALPSSSM